MVVYKDVNHMRRLQLEGQIFNKITVLSFSHVSNGNSIWDCICECGTRKKISGNDLRTLNTTSCGCNFLHFTRNKPAPMKGKTHKESTKTIMRKVHKGKKYALGTKMSKESTTERLLKLNNILIF